MSTRRQAQRIRRGFTVAEVLIAGALMTALMATVAVFSNFMSASWHDGLASTSSQLSAQVALHWVAPSVRMARGVVAGSSSTQLTLQLPAFGTDGAMVAPLENGQVVTFYLSDATGRLGANGNILWRSVNGTPDSTWSLRGGKGRIAVRQGGLNFTYYPTADPETVTITLTTTHASGQRISEFTSSQEFLLRNKGL
jgi:hypothetical protein